MKPIRNTRFVAALVLSAVALCLARPAVAQLGGLDDLLKKGKDLADKQKKEAEKKTESSAEGSSGSKGMVFSKSPINPAKPENLTTTFAAGDRIYGLVTLGDTFRAVTEAQTDKIIVEVKCHKNGKYDTGGSFNITLRKKALDAKTLLLDIAPDPGKMTAYKDKNIEYEKKWDRYGKRGGPMQLTKFLSGLGKGKTSIKLVLYRYKELASGEFTIEGDDFSKPYGELFKALENVDTAGVTMPKAKMSNAKLEAEMAKALKNSTVPEAKEGQILKVVIIDPDWHLERHRISGRVLFRYIRTDCALKEKDGPCWRWRFIFKQEFIGGKFQPVKLHGIGERKKIPLKNVTGKKS